MRTLTLIALLLLGFTVQAGIDDGWTMGDVSYDEMEDEESVSTTLFFVVPHDVYSSKDTRWMFGFSCKKQRSSGYSYMNMWIVAYLGDEKPYLSRKMTVIVKVDANKPMRLAFSGANGSTPSLSLKNPAWDVLRQFKAGNTAKVRMPTRSGTKDVDITLTGFTNGINPVLDLCG